MPGLRKEQIAQRIEQLLLLSGCNLVNQGFVGEDGDLPWEISLRYADGMLRAYRAYFWTVSHGGNHRPESEFRIQAKLRSARSLEFAIGTTLLFGYFSCKHSPLGSCKEAQAAPRDMEVFVAWDPLQHLHVGESSSCQVKFDQLLDAYLYGVSARSRRTKNGTEQVLALRSEHLANYLRAAAGGHNSLDASALTI